MAKEFCHQKPEVACNEINAMNQKFQISSRACLKMNLSPCLSQHPENHLISNFQPHSPSFYSSERLDFVLPLLPYTPHSFDSTFPMLTS